MDVELDDKLLRELRERVNDLLAGVQLLTDLEPEKRSEADKRCLASMNKSLYQLIRLIYHLELCGGDDPAFYPQIIDVAGLCKELCREVETFAEDLGVGFSWELKKESLLSLADAELLTQAVMNLLTNAFQAAGPGGQVSLSFSVSKTRYTVTVTDSGPGLQLPAEDADPFLKDGRGTGFGLKAARRVASLHGGALTLDTGKEPGLRSVLSLPIRTPDGSETVQQKPCPPSDGFSTPLVEFSPLLPLKEFYPENVE